MSTAPRILLMDTASLYYRAFYGIPDTLKAPDGTVVNAVRGIFDIIARLKTTYAPEVIVACWDEAWRPEWRVALMPTYKSHRLADPDGLAEDTPELLLPQVPLIAEGLELIGIPVIGAVDCEADDVIGTIARRWEGPVDVVTGDRDLFQLVDDSGPVRVLYTARGIRLLQEVDDAWLQAAYGVTGAQYVDFAVMRGDPSDGIPGVAGIGEKTAAALIAEFGSLAGIQAAAADPSTTMKPKVRQNLLASAAYLEAALEVVRVRDDAAISDVAEGGTLTPQRREAFEAFGKKRGLGGVTGRVLAALS